MAKYAKINLTKKLLRDLKDYEKNNKIHPKLQKYTLKKIIEEVWYDVPIIIDKHDVIVAWHCRKEVLMMLDYEYVDVIVKDKLSESQIRKYRLLDNKIAELAEDHIENIKLELEELEDQELNELYEFEIEKLDPDKEAIEDEVPETPTNIIVEKWDIFQLWEHRLMCWDSTNIDDVEKLMDWEKADMVFTDPPYWVEYEWWHNKKKRKWIKNDELSWWDLTWLFKDALSCASIITWDKSAFYVWYSSNKSIETFEGFNQLQMDIRQVIIWHKINSWCGAFMAQYMPTYEPCIYAVKHKWTAKWNWPTDEKAVWQLKKDSANEYHPTQKPVELSERAINNSSDKRDIVYDCFGWSGATIIWAEKTNRKCYMMELDEKYIQVIIKRYHQYTEWDKEIKCLNRDLDINLITDAS